MRPPAVMSAGTTRKGLRRWGLSASTAQIGACRCAPPPPRAPAAAGHGQADSNAQLREYVSRALAGKAKGSDAGAYSQ